MANLCQTGHGPVQTSAVVVLGASSCPAVPPPSPPTPSSSPPGDAFFVIGVGKSGHIGQKLVATFKSLAIHAVFLHPTEALHGDLGIIGSNDTLMFITFSGKTQELLIMLPHLDESLPTILLTSHTSSDTCEFIKHRPNTILLPAPIPEPEKISFGVSAPTTSTTVALAIGDAIAITAAKEINANIASVFAKNHPGGAIGAAARQPRTIKDIAVTWHDIPVTIETAETGLGFDLLRAGFDSESGWVRVQDRVASPSIIRGISRHDLNRTLANISNSLVSKSEMLPMSSETTIRQAGDIFNNMQLSPVDEDLACGPEAVIAVMEKGAIVGVLEAGTILNFKD
ncbi:Arabinose 5-phosphate isomerase [Fusarium acuminatum]|uniref:Arabinose 5-phosphate isomerase n=1 Tax=Fusarium acuminatum TaxID=5515 RepID=A0ABZ2WS07_9HYPO